MTQETTYIDPFSDTRYANLTPQQKREYDRELKERWDRAAEAESHYLDGENSKAHSIAVAMKKKGYPVQEIVELTGLKAEEVEKL